jgi:hypothetical protein
MNLKQMMLLTIACASAGSPLTAAALDTSALDTSALAPGRTAPVDIVRRIEPDAPVQIGAASVRPLPDAEGQPRALSPAAARSTLVVRSTDNLIGVSSNELVVIDKNPAAVQRKVAELAADATIKAYADNGIVVVRLNRFADLLPLKQRLAKAFPAARFDLPVRYFESTLK